MSVLLMRVLFICAVAAFPALPAAASEALGTWLSPPDGKGQTGHVEVKACGAALCGTLVRAYDPNGVQITTANVGKRLIWDMKSAGGGAYEGGRAFVPVLGAAFGATMQVKGSTLVVRGCAGPVCKSQTWQRVR